jgi:2-amino-4-hydroxy-6-hydroxymethyldihydropteridine diphosphokinase
VRAVIGLGTNLGDREEWLRQAIVRLRESLDVVGVSRIHETEPVGPPQPRYLNAAVLVRSTLAPHALLEHLLSIERAMGRERKERWGPRTIDLDLLWIEGVSVSDATLTVPHPELKKRSFALLPLLEVAPDAVDPVTGEAYAKLVT